MISPLIGAHNYMSLMTQTMNLLISFCVQLWVRACSAACVGVCLYVLCIHGATCLYILLHNYPCIYVFVLLMGVLFEFIGLMHKLTISLVSSYDSLIWHVLDSPRTYIISTAWNELYIDGIVKWDRHTFLPFQTGNLHI